MMYQEEKAIMKKIAWQLAALVAAFAAIVIMLIATYFGVSPECL